MLTILLGPDSYSKTEYIKSLQEKEGADLITYGVGEELPSFGRLLETDLFSKSKIFEIRQLIDLKEKEKLIKSKNHIILSLVSLDKRKKENKDLLNLPDIGIKNFFMPHSKGLDVWIKNKVEELNVDSLNSGNKILDDAVNELALRLGRDDFKEVKVGGKVIEVEEVYNLWQVENEIKKLLAFSADKKITKEMVELMVGKFGEVDVLNIVNSIAEKNQTTTFELIKKFFKQENSSDEKAGVILLNALLAEQFRNVVMVQNFTKSNLEDSKILEITSWKPGRLFVIKKISNRFSENKVKDFLLKLGALDEEVKTSSTPPKVLLDLILTQMF